MGVWDGKSTRLTIGFESLEHRQAKTTSTEANLERDPGLQQAVL